MEAEQGVMEAQEWKVKKERSTGHNPKECPVCMTVFDDAVQRPRTLPCGHTVCTLCVNKLKHQGRVACPECRVRHTVPEGGQFPICYAVEALIRLIGEPEKAAAAWPPPSAGTGKGAAAAAGLKEAAGLSRKMRSFLQEQFASVVAAITACQEVQEQLDLYQTTLRGWGEQQQQLEDRLQGLLDQSRSARELVRQDEPRVVAKKEEARELERQLHAALEALRTPATDKEAGVAVTEVVRCTCKADKLVEECRESFPNTNTATTVMKVREASNGALEASQAVQAVLEAHRFVAEEENRPQLEAACTIEDRLQAILTPSLKVSQVVPPSLPCTVFLDLSWPGSGPRRVHVRLSPDTPWGRQAVLLCTGQRGPSYAGSRLFQVGCKGQPGERVYGGDYESSNGKGGAALLPDIDKGEYRNSGKAGAVWGCWSSDPARCAVFGIRTRECHDGGSGGVCGRVVQGLDAVMAAAKHTNIKEVTISDCGVVL